jgi:glycerate 2-kinase
MRIDGALFQVPGTGGLRRVASRILARAVAAVDPYGAASHAIRLEGNTVHVADRPFPLVPASRVAVVGAGKASGPMAHAVENTLGGRISTGLVASPTKYAGHLRRIAVREAGHPLPDARGEAAAAEMLALVSGLGPDDLVICLISGGGSALLPLPQEGLTLRDKIRTTDLLLRSGADIVEINTVRKHLSRVKGGQLARAAWPARLATLVVSDIVGSPLDAIASGPTVPDPTTFADALAVLAEYRLTERVPPAVLATLRRGAAGQLPETPKPGDPAFAAAQTTVIADNAVAARAALAEAESAGFRAQLLSTYVEGEAREVGGLLAAIAREIVATGNPLTPPACVVCGGETTVTVEGGGRGGRNQEVALSAGRTLAGIADVLVVSFATDGIDGPTDAAGAVADGTAWARARSKGFEPARRLADNDAYPVLDAIGDMIRTGPTNTNVNDLMLVLCGVPAEETVKA